MNQLQNYEFVLILIDDGDEIETSVSLVDDLVVLVVDKVAHLGLPCNHQLIHLSSCTPSTSFKNLCFSFWDMFVEYHFVSRDRPCLLIKKKQWIILIYILFKYLYSFNQFTYSVSLSSLPLPSSQLPTLTIPLSLSLPSLFIFLVFYLKYDSLQYCSLTNWPQVDIEMKSI